MTYSIRKEMYLAGLLVVAMGLSACGDGKSKHEKNANNFLLSTMEEPAGYKVKETMGQHCRIFEHTGSDYGDRSGITLNEGAATITKAGANGWINLSFNTVQAPSTASGVASNPIVQVCGDMVVVEKED